MSSIINKWTVTVKPPRPHPRVPPFDDFWHIPTPASARSVSSHGTGTKDPRRHSTPPAGSRLTRTCVHGRSLRIRFPGARTIVSARSNSKSRNKSVRSVKARFSRKRSMELSIRWLTSSLHSRRQSVGRVDRVSSLVILALTVAYVDLDFRGEWP